MADKTIYDLTENQSLDAGDLFEQDVLQNNERKSLKTSLGAIAEKINTSLTYSGLNTTSKTVVGAINELEAGGGGGTGGHTIIDENGTSMTARSGLQFFGAVEVTDDSASNRTLVEVLGGDFYNPIIYSTEEREIGVWTDGKPLYEKTITFSNVSKSGKAYFGIANSDTIFVNDGYITEVDTMLPYVHGAASANNIGGFIRKEQNNSDSYWEFRGGNDAPSTLSGWMNVRYTKTTDVAGSGSWTPQGVPTHHYSTDEQIIGTWIDGSTLYEKTFVFNSQLVVSNSQWTDTEISNNGISQIIDARGIDETDKSFWSLNALVGSGNYIQFLAARYNGSAYIRSVIIQYTKSS